MNERYPSDDLTDDYDNIKATTTSPESELLKVSAKNRDDVKDLVSKFPIFKGKELLAEIMVEASALATDDDPAVCIVFGDQAHIHAAGRGPNGTGCPASPYGQGATSMASVDNLRAWILQVAAGTAPKVNESGDHLLATATSRHGVCFNFSAIGFGNFTTALGRAGGFSEAWEQQIQATPNGGSLGAVLVFCDQLTSTIFTG